jgi:6-phosphogluconolactonase (cycloisomerase 2 family)
MYTVAQDGTWTPTVPATVATGNQPAVVVTDPQGKFAYVSNDRDNTIGEYAIDQTTGVLTPLSPATAPTGAFPQDFTLSPDGRFAYSANSSDDTVTAFTRDAATGQLTPIQAASTPGASIFDPGGVTVSPDGKFLCVVGQWVDIFQIDTNTGKLTQVAEPAAWAGSRNFKATFDPSGRFLYVPDNDSTNVWQFAFDPATGKLTYANNSPAVAGQDVAWVAVDPTGKFAYVSNRMSGSLTEFSRNSSGILSPLASTLTNSSLSTVGSPWQITFDPSGQIVYVLGESGSLESFATTASGNLVPLNRTVSAGLVPSSFALVAR